MRFFVVTFVLAVAVVTAAVWLIPRRHPDAGALEVACGVLRPHPSTVLVGVDESARQHLDRMSAAVAAWETATGVELAAVEPALPGSFDVWTDALEGRGPEPVGRVLVVAGAPAQRLVQLELGENMGDARLRWDPRRCVIGYAVIVMPDGPASPDALRTAAEHELGHIFGLAHDTDPSSVMFHPIRAIRPTASITAADADLVRARAQ